jgi:hypothetical protein
MMTNLQPGDWPTPENGRFTLSLDRPSLICFGRKDILKKFELVLKKLTFYLFFASILDVSGRYVRLYVNPVRIL